MRRILPPMITYAQNFEDVLLRRALSEIERGFYVDVGAFHPVVDSVTCWFYGQGWTGINVEPNPRFQALLREARPHDLNLAAAVAGATGEIELHLLDGLSTTVPAVADHHASAGRVADRVRVPALSLNDLFARHVGGRTVDFLKIDVEGAEAAILDPCPFDTVRPRLIVVEATEPDSVTQSAAAWEAGLLGKGYAVCYFDGLNRYYVRNEDAWRAGLFDAPPNVFDGFRLAFTDNRVDYVASARTVLDQVPEGGIRALIADRDRMRSERDHWSAEAQTFLGARDALAVKLRDERTERETELRAERVARELELRAERSFFAQEIVKLAQETTATEAERKAAHAAELAEREAERHAERSAHEAALQAERVARETELRAERSFFAQELVRFAQETTVNEAERKAAHAAELAEREAVHARALAEREAERAAREAAHARALAEGEENQARALAETREDFDAAREELEARQAALEAELAELRAAHRETQARLAESEARTRSLSAARDASLLSSARLQIKLDALRLPMPT